MIRTSRLLIWLAAILIVIAVVYGAGYLYITKPSDEGGNISLFPDIAELSGAKFAEDKSEALALYREIKNDPTKSPDEKALAEVAISGVPFIQSGRTGARIEEIRNLKASFLDQSVLRGTRAAILSVLGKEYAFSGGNPEIFKEVYKDAPFSQYLVPNDVDRTTINIEKASYDIYPNTVAAITVAQSAANLEFLKKKTAQTDSNIAMAEDYLQKADDAAIQDAKDNPGYSRSDRFISYMLGRANTVGRLAIIKGEPYKSTYRSEFDNLIAVAQSTPRPLPNELILNARFSYARILIADKDTKAAELQLNEIARILNGLENADRYSFVQLMRNESTYRAKGAFWASVKKMFAQSPDFETAVNKILNAPAQ